MFISSICSFLWPLFAAGFTDDFLSSHSSFSLVPLHSHSLAGFVISRLCLHSHLVRYYFTPSQILHLHLAGNEIVMDNWLCCSTGRTSFNCSFLFLFCHSDDVVFKTVLLVFMTVNKKTLV